MTTFIREAFYVVPPNSNSSLQEWQEWLEKDEKAAIQAKREFTKKSKDKVVSEFAVSTRKVNGRYVQCYSSMAFAEDGIEPSFEADQEEIVAKKEERLNSNSRGKSNNKRRRAAKRKAKRAKYRVS